MLEKLDLNSSNGGAEATVRSLEQMGLSELREFWSSHWGPPPRLRSTELLRLIAAWRVQAAEEGGLSPETEARLRSRRMPRAPIGPNGQAGPAELPPDKVMIQRIRAAHDVLRACGVRPDAPDARPNHVLAPMSSHQMAWVQWAFLAPDLQKAVLEGRDVGRPDLALMDGRKIPLLWSEQRTMFANSKNKKGDGRSKCLPSTVATSSYNMCAVD